MPNARQANIWILGVGAVLCACGARSTILDGPGDPLPGAGGAGTSSTSSGPFAVTSAGSGEEGSTGDGAPDGTSGGPGTGTSTGSGVVECQGGPPGEPLASACDAYACELANSGDSDCAACLNQAVLTTCAHEIHRATSHHHHCGDANACAESCGGADLCDCIASCMEQGSNKCAYRWADAFWCISGACASACGG